MFTIGVPELFTIIIIAAFILALLVSYRLNRLALRTLRQSNEIAAYKLIAKSYLVLILYNIISSLTFAYLANFGIQSNQLGLTIVGSLLVVYNIIQVPRHYLRYKFLISL